MQLYIKHNPCMASSLITGFACFLLHQVLLTVLNNPFLPITVDGDFQISSGFLRLAAAEAAANFCALVRKRAMPSKEMGAEAGIRVCT